MLRIVAFGGLAILRGDARVMGAAAQPRRMAVLAMVARAGARGVSRDRLLAMLWPDAGEEQGRNALKQAIYALRRDAGAGEIFLGSKDLRLNPDAVTCDVVEFEQFLRANELERAVALCDGPFLDGFRLPTAPEFEQWIEDERRGLARAHSGALERMLRDSRERGDVLATVAWARKLAALEPLNARVAASLMQALLDAGDRHGALQHARIYEALLQQELDLPPDREVTELARRIRNEPASSVPSRLEPPARASAGGEAEGVAATVAPPATTVRSPANDLSVAVLPLACISSESDAEHLGDGLSEELIHVLGAAGLRVPGRTSTRALANGAADVREVGERLGVLAVLEGSLRRTGGRVRVNVRLIHAARGVTMWSERYDRESDDLLLLQDEIASSIVGDVDRVLRAHAGLAPRLAPREEADELYARGRSEWDFREAGLGRGLELFRRAVAVDPTHARSHAGLADAYTQLAFYGYLPTRRAVALAEVAIAEALRLDPGLAEAHAARGSLLTAFSRDHQAGIAELRRAVQLDETWAAARHRLAFFLLCVHGDSAEALKLAREAAEMQGTTAHARVMLGMILLGARCVDEALAQLHAAIDVEAPSYLAYHWLVWAYLLKNSTAEAVTAAVAEASLSERHPWAVANLIITCAAAGQLKRAELLFAGLQARATRSFVQPTLIAMARGALGDAGAAMDGLARALEAGDPTLVMMRQFPMFDVFRTHDRYPRLLREAGWS